jgi:hypothetical protein
MTLCVPVTLATWVVATSLQTTGHIQNARTCLVSTVNLLPWTANKFANVQQDTLVVVLWTKRPMRLPSVLRLIVRTVTSRMIAAPALAMLGTREVAILSPILMLSQTAPNLSVQMDPSQTTRDLVRAILGTAAAAIGTLQPRIIQLVLRWNAPTAQWRTTNPSVRATMVSTVAVLSMMPRTLFQIVLKHPLAIGLHNVLTIKVVVLRMMVAVV